MFDTFYVAAPSLVSQQLTGAAQMVIVLSLALDFANLWTCGARLA